MDAALAAGDEQKAGADAAQSVTAGPDDAGRTEQAGSIRTPEAMLEQARTGLHLMR